ncbi:alpha/beta hydrolase [Parapedobacter sp. ISTM3]|uniref:alpha/beta fold hydrolase n=1 Tax=Parapedobacter sp. ISTM3 TaxID=2800130 RepID=UPI00190779F4|nr:alpha/beta hydrolase [Parapedobacter sp. ISTM3]MBK1439604.1 alpha/beta hydrolase [Parapedobacter sp. ISTM3]
MTHSNTRNPSAVHHRSVQLNGLDIFYRESGPADAPVLLLLHGYPTSSHMFRNLIPLLNGRYRIIAPDLPGFGYSSAPSHKTFTYTFDRLASVMQDFIEHLELTKFAIYVFDYGAPTGYRLAMSNPEKITAIISQNGNAYEEGLGEGWKPIQAYWKHDTQENRDALRGFVTLAGTKFQYYTGVPDESLIAPEVITMDQYFLDRPGSDEIQLDLLRDYKNNVLLYPKFQAYFSTWKPRLLAVWGNKDPFFLPPGAEAYKRDIPDAIVKFYDTGHFALETHAAEIGADILKFLDSLS